MSQSEPLRITSSPTKAKVFKVLVVSLLLCAACALFPPRHQARTGDSAPRGFLFNPSVDFDLSGATSTYSAEIDGGRLLAECVLVCAVTGLILLFILADPTEE